METKVKESIKISDLRYQGFLSSMYYMAIPVVEFSREGYNIRKVFG